MSRKPLPPDWLAIVETQLNSGESVWEVPKTVDGEPNEPQFCGIIANGSWVVTVRCVKPSTVEDDFDIKAGDLVPFSINYLILC